MRFCCCNSSPRGDGNTPQEITLTTLLYVAIHPREGTETGTLASNSSSKNVAIHPREGTETRPARPLSVWHRVAIHPREGTETMRPSPDWAAFCCCNSSPRGDGNLDIAKKQIDYIRCCNSSPRGDGNLRKMGLKTDLGNVAIHPREGTETVPLPVCPPPAHPRCNSSPRGDGNADGMCNQYRYAVAIHPREGTETAPAMPQACA